MPPALPPHTAGSIMAATPDPAPLMPSDNESLTQIESQARSELDADALERWRVSYLGRRGRLTLVLRGLTGLPLEERKNVGAQANRLKRELEAELQEKKARLGQSATEALIAERIDVTLPGPPLRAGRLHPTTQTLRDVLGCFGSIGFQVVEGPESEWDH